MTNINSYQYVSSLYNKFLEIYINKLKNNVARYLENNDLEKAKGIIKKIENIRKFQKEINIIFQDYLNNSPEEKRSVDYTSKVNNSNENFKHYTYELLGIIELNEEVELFKLKDALYNEIVNHIGVTDISNNDKFPTLLNWEVDFYRAINLLLSKGLIRFDDGYYFSLTDEGSGFYGQDNNIDNLVSYSSDNQDDLDQEEILYSDLSEKFEDLDLISSIRSYLLSNLITDKWIMADEDSDYYDIIFSIIEELYDLDGHLITSWEQIKENKYYIVNLYGKTNEQTVFIKNKINQYNVVVCIDKDDLITYYAFI